MLACIYQPTSFRRNRSVTVPCVLDAVAPGGLMPPHRSVHHILSDQLICAICREPVNLETAKTDDGGKGVHEECYVQKIVRNDGELGQRKLTSEGKNRDGA
jgi:hypothetical protein